MIKAKTLVDECFTLQGQIPMREWGNKRKRNSDLIKTFGKNILTKEKLLSRITIFRKQSLNPITTKKIYFFN